QADGGDLPAVPGAPAQEEALGGADAVGELEVVGGGPPDAELDVPGRGATALAALVRHGGAAGQRHGETAQVTTHRSLPIGRVSSHDQLVETFGDFDRDGLLRIDVRVTEDTGVGAGGHDGDAGGVDRQADGGLDRRIRLPGGAGGEGEKGGGAESGGDP